MCIYYIEISGSYKEIIHINIRCVNILYIIKIFNIELHVNYHTLFLILLYILMEYINRICIYLIKKWIVLVILE